MTSANWLGIAGGLSLFLYGIRLMCDGIELIAGARLKSILEKLTRNRFLALLVGISITAIIQSSNATTAMTVGFVNAGLMEFSRASGIIFGANVGSTATGLLIALNIADIAPLLSFLGVVAMLFFKERRVRSAGQIVAGLGILFLGMTLMKQNMTPLSTEAWFTSLMLSFSEKPLLAILTGVIFTSIVQSVSASVGILQAMAMAGAVTSLGQVAYVILGMNIGCCIAAVTAAIGGTRDAKRTACIHVLFNVFSCILFLLLWSLSPLPAWIASLSDNVVLQIAYFNTIEMLGGVIVFFPFLPLMEKLACVLIRREDKPAEGPRLMHIRRMDLGMTSIAVEQAQAEVERMFQLACKNLHMACAAMFDRRRNSDDLTTIEKNEETLDFLNRAITEALIEINRVELSGEDAAIIDRMHHVIRDYERIGDHSNNIAGYVAHCRENGLQFSQHAQQELSALTDRVYKIVDEAHSYMKDPQLGGMARIEREEQDIDDEVERLQNNHIRRLDEGRCTADVGMLYIEILTDLERVADHALNIAEAAIVKGGKPAKTK